MQIIQSLKGTSVISSDQLHANMTIADLQNLNSISDQV